MRRRKLRDCSLPMISGKPAGHVASGCGRTGAEITASATTTMRGGGGGPSMSCPCGTLCIAACLRRSRTATSVFVDGRQQHGCRLLQPCFLCKTCAVVQALHRNLSIYTSIQMHCTTAQVEANLGLLCPFRRCLFILGKCLCLMLNFFRQMSRHDTTFGFFTSRQVSRHDMTFTLPDQILLRRASRTGD